MNLAPIAIEATMSAPFMMPASIITSTSSPTSRMTSGQEVEGHRCAVQLPPALVDEHDRVDTGNGESLGVFDVLHTLDSDHVRPDRAHLGEVVEVDGRDRLLRRGVAVLRCCTCDEGPVRRSRTGPLTCVGDTGIEPVTSSV